MLRIVQAITELKESLKNMTELVLDNLDRIRKCIHSGDFSEVENIIRHDQKIDALEKLLDQQAVELLALINPHASDLRFVFSVIKLDVDLERIGDECKNVAKELRRVKDPLPPEIPEMSDRVYEMVKEAFQSLVGQDPLLAREIIRKDIVIDAMEKEILTKYPNNIPVAFMAKALERISDHSTNIAENVVYAIEGADITDMRKQYKNQPQQ